MKTRFYLLALLSGLFLIVVLPVGIVFLFFVGLYYLASNRDENKVNAIEQCSLNPDFDNLFNNSDYVKEQEKLR